MGKYHNIEIPRAFPNFLEGKNISFFCSGQPYENINLIKKDNFNMSKKNQPVNTKTGHEIVCYFSITNTDMSFNT